MFEIAVGSNDYTANILDFQNVTEAEIFREKENSRPNGEEGLMNCHYLLVN